MKILSVIVFIVTGVLTGIIIKHVAYNRGYMKGYNEALGTCVSILHQPVKDSSMVAKVAIEDSTVTHVFYLRKKKRLGNENIRFGKDYGVA